MRRHQGRLKVCQAQHLEDGRGREVYTKQESLEEEQVRKELMDLGNVWDIEVVSKQSPTSCHGRRKRRKERRACWSNTEHREGEHFKAAVRSVRCGRKIKDEEGWDKANQQM